MPKRISNAAFLKKVKDTSRFYGMLEKNDKVLVAVSGGPDSVCLVKTLMEISKPLGLEITAANMDHGIRGKESAGDSAFVRELCGQLGIKCFHKKVNIGSKGVRGLSVEEIARKERYKFLKETALSVRCNVIATGHTMDDQAETVIMNLIRGASLKGLSGIPPVRMEAGIRVVRPLIRVSKKEILDFLDGEKQKYCYDHTNDDLRYMRNKVRKEILPFLERYNPKVRRAMVNCADNVRELAGSDRMISDKEAGSIVRKDCKNVKLFLQPVLLYPSSARKEMFRYAFDLAGGNLKKLNHGHWMEISMLITSTDNGKSLDLPGNIKVVRARGVLTFRKIA